MNSSSRTEGLRKWEHMLLEYVNLENKNSTIYLVCGLPL